MILIGDFFAIVIVKQLFGGIGKNFLNPALAARAFMLSWASAMSTWVVPGSKLPLLGTVDVVTSATPMSYLHANNLAGLTEVYDLQDMLIGFIGGSLGEVCGLLLTIGGVWLIFRKTGQNRKAAVWSLSASVVIRTAFACFVNAFITLPLYAAAMGVSLDEVVRMVAAVNPAITNLTTFIILATIPFNILKLGINYLIGYLLYERLHAVSPAFRAV